MQGHNLGGVFLLVVSLVWLWQRYGPGSKIRRAFARLPCVKGVFLLGNVQELTGFSKHKHTFEALQRTGYLCGLRVAGLRFVQVGDPVIAHELMQISDTADKGWLYSVFERLTSKNVPSIFSSPTNSYWKSIRKGVAPAFNGGNLRQGFSRLNDLLPAVLEHIRQVGTGKSVNIESIASRVTMDAIHLAIFGKTRGCVERVSEDTKPEMGIVLQDAFDVIAAIAPAPWLLNFTFLPAINKAARAVKRLHAQNQELIRDLRASDPPSSSLGAHLLSLHDSKTGQLLGDHQLEAELGTFFGAGFETSTIAIGWALYSIATHLKVQQKVAAELQQHNLLASPAEPKPRALEWDDLGKLEYLRNVIKESMRLYPVVAGGTLRALKKDTKLGPYPLAAGTAISIHFYSIHRNPAYWDHATEFLPERWNVPNADFVQPKAGMAAGNVKPDDISADVKHEAEMSSKPNREGARGARPSDGINAEELWKPDKSAKISQERSPVRRFMPFSSGLRNCVGQNLANTTVLTFVATMCSHFHVDLAPEMGGPEGVEKITTLALTLHVKGGLRLNFTPRSQA
ncbi:hypothetical protein WJX74_007991 [Apatococcus lobatus]|uniref:Cytochrome P450 n=1 Tax=Apatococcus lobatus TaxID=904363 RepID=A0AAW1QJV9_9CHLO